MKTTFREINGKAKVLGIPAYSLEKDFHCGDKFHPKRVSVSTAGSRHRRSGDQSGQQNCKNIDEGA